MIFHVHSSVTITDSEAGTLSGPKASTGSPSGSNQAELTRLHYIYDAWNRLTYVKNDSGGNPGTTLATYEYDGLNRRIEKTVGANTDESFYNENWQVLEVRRNGDADPREQYTWDAGYIDTPIFKAYDAAAGQVQERYLYDPYGRLQFYDRIWTKLSSSAKDNSILYGGYVFDPETNNYYARNRYLQPSMGKWTQRDFVGYVDGANLYQYVNSAPITGLDPFGLLDFSDPKPQTAEGTGILVLDNVIGPGQIFLIKTDAGSEVKVYKHTFEGDVTRADRARIKISIGEIKWCHGYTFAEDTSYSPFGASVPVILKDEYKLIDECDAKSDDVIIFSGAGGWEVPSHSGRLGDVVIKDKKLDREKTKVKQKKGIFQVVQPPPQGFNAALGPKPPITESLAHTLATYPGDYRVYRRKSPTSKPTSAPSTQPATAPSTRLFTSP